VPLLLTVPGIGSVLAFTIAAEIGDIARFPSAKKLCGYTGLCPRVNQSGDKDRRGPLTKQGPKYLRWALLEVTMHALKHPLYSERHASSGRLTALKGIAPPKPASNAAWSSRRGGNREMSTAPPTQPARAPRHPRRHRY
jgi:transposase